MDTTDLLVKRGRRVPAGSLKVYDIISPVNGIPFIVILSHTQELTT